MKNSLKYGIIEDMIVEFTKDGRRCLRMDEIKIIKAQLMVSSKGRENPETLVDDIRDTYNRLY